MEKVPIRTKVYPYAENDVNLNQCDVSSCKDIVGREEKIFWLLLLADTVLFPHPEVKRTKLLDSKGKEGRVSKDERMQGLWEGKHQLGRKEVVVEIWERGNRKKHNVCIKYCPDNGKM